MAEYTGMLLTDRGRDLMAKAEAGATLTFTKVKIGDGQLVEGQTLEGLTDLVHPLKILTITSVQAEGDGLCRIRSNITNAGIVQGFYVREVGLFATDPDLGEILYAVATATAADYMPPEGGTTVVNNIFDIVVIIGNATNLSANIAITGFVPMDDFLDHLDEPFKVKSAAYDSVNNRLALTIARGRGEFPNTRVIKLGDSIYNISAPAINTTYYVYLLSDGTFTNNTTGAVPGGTSGAILLATVATGATVSSVTIVDKRAQIDGASSALYAHMHEITPHSGYLALLGANNQVINEFKAHNQRIDTRSAELTYTGQDLTQVVEKDGATVVKTTALNYDAGGVLKTVTETVNGKTITITLDYNADGFVSTVTRGVV